MDHASDLIINNVFSHNGSDGSILKDRIERYCFWRGSLGENMVRYVFISETTSIESSCIMLYRTLDRITLQILL